jgi:hypothetical protein
MQRTSWPEESKADIYRGRAEQARLAAKAAVDPQNRRMFEELALSYEQLAGDEEWLGTTN